MNVRNFKTALIAVLVLGIILQTGKLWFEESSGHNFFSSAWNTRSYTSVEQKRIEPEKIMVNIGDMRYIRAWADDEIKAITDGHILQLVRSGKYINSSTESLLTLLDTKSVLYSYPITLTADSFARSLGEDSGDFISKAQSFNAIVIKPARSSSEYMRIYVVDTFAGTAHTFETLRGVSEPLLKETDRLAELVGASESGLFYISSEQNSIDFFTQNVFLPQWQASQYTYLMPFVTNPVEDGNFESIALSFFDNPLGVLSAVDPAGAPFVSGRESVVKYYAEDEVLEYTNYQAIKNTRTTFNMAYTSALAFMERDATLVNDVIMTEALLNDGSWVLSFDYVWGGAQVFAGGERSIEIAVTGETVTKYTRKSKRISTSDLMGKTDISFLAALDSVLESEDYEGIDNLELRYNTEQNGICELEWFFESAGQTKRVFK